MYAERPPWCPSGRLVSSRHAPSRRPARAPSLNSSDRSLSMPKPVARPASQLTKDAEPVSPDLNREDTVRAAGIRTPRSYSADVVIYGDSNRARKHEQHHRAPLGRRGDAAVWTSTYAPHPVSRRTHFSSIQRDRESERLNLRRRRLTAANTTFSAENRHFAPDDLAGKRPLRRSVPLHWIPDSVDILIRPPWADRRDFSTEHRVKFCVPKSC